MERLEKLEKIRLEKGFSRNELAKLSGVKQETIVSLELGRTNVDNVQLSTLIKLAKALHCKVVDLVDSDLTRYVR